MKLGGNENLSALDLTIILRANAATRTANRYEIAIHGTTATLNRYYSGTCTQLGQWTVDINDRLLKAGAVWDDVNGSGYGGVTVTLKSGNNTLFSFRDESNLNVSTPGYFGLATDSSIQFGRVTEYVDMRSVIADKGNWKSNSSITWENNDTKLTPVGSATAGYTGRTFGDAEFVVGFESGLNTGAFPCFILRAPTEQDLLDNPWSGAKYSVIIKEGSFEIQHWPELWKPGASILSSDGRSALADNKGFVPPYKDTLVKVSTVNTDYGVWIRIKAGDTIVASWIDENNYIQNDGYFGVCGYTEPLSISVPDVNTYVPVIGDPDAKPGSTLDTSALEKLISDAEALVETECTPTSWTALETALANAQAVLANKNATQAQVDAELTALQAAMTGLVKAADTSELEKLITDAEALVETEYTPTSWAALETALANAQAVLENKDATQVQVDAEVTALQTAIAGLVKAIVITSVTFGNGQANIEFAIKSANGKGYAVYISDNGVAGSLRLCSNVNYNSKGAHVKGLTNGKTYYAYIEYIDGNGNVSRSEPVKLTPGK